MQTVNAGGTAVPAGGGRISKEHPFKVRSAFACIFSTKLRSGVPAMLQEEQGSLGLLNQCLEHFALGFLCIVPPRGGAEGPIHVGLEVQIAYPWR